MDGKPLGRFEIVKTDDAERLVFGWAMIAKTKDGQLVTDLQGDQIEPADLEKAFYEFVEDARKGGEMHEGQAGNRLVECCVFTREKMQKMGIPAGHLPEAAWVGFRCTPEAFERVKKGERLMFSVEGSGDRVPVEA